MKNHPIDTDWFLARMESLGLTMYRARGRAQRERRTPIVLQGLEGPLPYASFYRLIHGERGMSLREAVQLAAVLEVSIDELARRAGCPVKEVRRGPRALKTQEDRPHSRG